MRDAGGSSSFCPCWFVIALGVCGGLARAEAQEPESAENEARALFDAGRTAFDAGRFESALESFRRAHDLTARPALLFNIGAAAERLRRDDEALAYYERYLRELPSADNRELVESRIAFLRGARARATDDTVQARAVSAPLTEPARGPEGGGDIASEWWLWTIVAVVVVGAGVGIGAGIAASDPGTAPPPSGNFGGVARALTVRF